MAETKNAYLENEMLVEEVSNKAAILTKIFNHYANRTEHQTHDADSTADTEDGVVDYLTFRALSQLAHDFGICPILVEVARLYELYSELDAEAAQGLQKTESSSTKVSWVHTAANIPVEPNRLNYAQYLALLAVIAHQASVFDQTMGDQLLNSCDLSFVLPTVFSRRRTSVAHE